MATLTQLAYQVLDNNSSSSWGIQNFSTSHDHLLCIANIKSDSRVNSSFWYDYGGLQFGQGGSFVTSGYTTLQMYGDGWTDYYDENGSDSSIKYLHYPGLGGTANTFGVIKIWVPHYAYTSAYKQAMIQTFTPNNSSSPNQWSIALVAGVIPFTQAINCIRILDDTASNFLYGSTFTLYGVDGA